jgi:hypothetical protein
MQHELASISPVQAGAQRLERSDQNSKSSTSSLELAWERSA